MNNYIDLLELDYPRAVAYLLEKYGESTEDYFKEKSYSRFLNDEIKTIGKGKVSRTSEGLYCHHIKENEYQNMAQENFIKNQNIPFEYQKKEHLVYCDLIEHAILHAIISKETNFQYGKPGLDVFLIPNIIEWYVQESKPTVQWMINCYEKSYIDKKEAIYLLETIQDYLGY